MNKKKTIVVNLFAGPGTGKSTTMAQLFSELKWRGVDCEMAHEYAKEVVWQNSLEVLDDQLYIFAKQQHRFFRLKEKVEVIITDSPILLSLIYGNHMTETFKTLVKEQYNIYDNMNFYLERQKKYNPNGRLQSFEKAKEIDQKLKTMLDYHQFPYDTFTAKKESTLLIADKVMERLEEIRSEMEETNSKLDLQTA